jgi:hypothetical protein
MNKEMTIRDILDGWDGEMVEVTLVTGEKVSGPISVFGAGVGELFSINVDLPGETIYRIDAVIGARWIANYPSEGELTLDAMRAELSS